jgi:hypothetical protein
VSRVLLTEEDENELYVILKPMEGGLTEPLDALLRRVERELFARLTVEEVEKLASRFAPGR